MRNLILVILSIFLLNVSSLVFTCAAADVSIVDEGQEYVVGLINTIRLDPLSYAQSLGYDKNILAEKLPWLADDFENGFAACIGDGALKERAASLNDIDGKEPQPQALPDPEYDYSLFREKSGVVSFNNFMSVKSACKIVIENIFMQALDPDQDGLRPILDSRFNIVGVSVKSGRLQGVGDMVNAYYITICFASSARKYEVQTMNMINQLRAEPVKLLRSLGVKIPLAASENWPLIRSILNTDYTPLLDSSVLHDSIKNASGNLITDGFDDVNSSVFYTKHELQSPVHTVNEIFSSIVFDELKAWPAKNAVFSTAQYAGLKLKYVPVVVGGDSAIISVCTVDTGEKQSFLTGVMEIYGVVYSDTDGNGFYSPWEGKNFEPVVVFDKQNNNILKKTFTDNAGHFTLKIAGQQAYGIRISSGERMVTLDDIYVDKDFFLPIKLTMPVVIP